jgi:hypothetical protein
VWLLACCNGFNLIDGMDGLAAGAGVLAALAIAISALFAGNTMLAAAALPLAGALAGFLCFNFSPAKICLGDSGSFADRVSAWMFRNSGSGEACDCRGAGDCAADDEAASDLYGGPGAYPSSAA